jgi:actin-like ATPase involved in cell morphogenesis
LHVAYHLQTRLWSFGDEDIAIYSEQYIPRIYDKVVLDCSFNRCRRICKISKGKEANLMGKTHENITAPLKDGVIA